MNQTPIISEGMKLNYSLNKMLANWREHGYSSRDINAELDTRILDCGKVWYDHLKTCDGIERKFTLFKSALLALKYSYGILAAHGHLPRREEFTQEIVEECEGEWRNWIISSEFKKSELTMAVLALQKFAEIELTGKPFIVYDNNAT